MCVLCFSVIAQKLKVEDVVAKHLESIGSLEARSAVKSQIAVGNITLKSVAQRSLTSEGRIVLASAGNKNFFGLTTNAVDYPTDKFSFDGSKAKIGYIRNGTRSILGNFMFSNRFLLEDGLIGGTLANSWVLLNFDGKNAKLSLDGTKKIDGKEVYSVSYSTSKNNGTDVTLYFDKNTFHHLRSEYKSVSSASIGSTPDQSSRFSESRLKVTENFSDFRNEKSLTMPHKYQLVYSITGQNGTTEIVWDSILNEFAYNQNLAPTTFDAEAN